MTASPPPAVRWLVNALGWLALFATLALLSPGVQISAAAEPLASSDPAGPSCQAGPDDEQRVVDLSFLIERLRAQAAVAEPGDSEVVMLNNRGYNYGAAPAPDLATIQAEQQLLP